MIILVCTFCETDMDNIKKVSPTVFSETSLGIILDVRTSIEHAEKCLDRAHHHIPLQELNPEHFMNEKGFTKDTPIYLLCRTGKRSTLAAEKFIEQGFTKIYVIEGGLLACEAAGHKIKQSTLNMSVISLERQVRIAAGSMVILGSLFGLIFNPLFMLIPLFIGGGLVFSGITNCCGLGSLLIKAPWNRDVKSDCNP